MRLRTFLFYWLGFTIKLLKCPSLYWVRFSLCTTRRNYVYSDFIYYCYILVDYRALLSLNIKGLMIKLWSWSGRHRLLPLVKIVSFHYFEIILYLYCIKTFVKLKSYQIGLQCPQFVCKKLNMNLDKGFVQRKARSSLIDLTLHTLRCLTQFSKIIRSNIKSFVR